MKTEAFGNSDVLELSEAIELFSHIEHQKDIEDEDYDFLYADMVDYAIQYSSIRSRWNLMTKEERNEKDSSRTSTHNAFIRSCDALARYMAKIGKDYSWRERLGLDRKKVGDFACWICSIIAIRAR